MQPSYTGYIAPSEWRWLTVVSVVLILLAFSPFLLVVATSDGNWQFMGALHDYTNSAVYLSKMQQGAGGHLLTDMLHTPEVFSSTLYHSLYALLGQLANLTALPIIIVFHLARVAASLFMYIALYQLGATIWTRLRTRRLFFLLVSLLSGIGWLVSLFVGRPVTPDVTAPQLFPFTSTLVNVHVPLTFGILALLSAVLVAVFRPGFDDPPAVNNGGGLAFVLSLLLVIIYPEAILPLVFAISISIAFETYRKRQLPHHALRWGLWVLVPALPITAYYFVTLQFNPSIREWLLQRAVPATLPHWMFLGILFPLLIALPGLYRAVRRFERDGDRFMLIWLVVLLLLAYSPLPLGMQVLVGLMLPLAYFATRALEDFWFKFLPRRWRYRLLVALIPLVGFNHVFDLMLPVTPLFNPSLGSPYGMVLEPEYRVAFDWLQPRLRQNVVVLAAPETSLWLPFWVQARTVYGHPAETLNAEQKRRDVRRWFRAEAPNAPICEALIRGSSAYIVPYTVDYVLVGPRERALGTTTCTRNMSLVAAFGQVDIYRVNG